MRSARSKALKAIGTEIFAWSEQEKLHFRGHLMGCAAKYRVGLLQAAGVKLVFPECLLYYADDVERGVRLSGVEGGILWDSPVFGADLQYGVLDPMIADLPAFARLSGALSREGGLQNAVIMSAVASRELAGSAQTQLDSHFMGSILELVGFLGPRQRDEYAVGPHRLSSDFGAHTFGPWGPDYPIEEEILALRDLEGTGIHEVESLRGASLVAVAAHELCADKRSTFCSWPWVSAVLSQAYATARAHCPSKVVETTSGYFWLPTLNPVKEELESNGFVKAGDMAVELTSSGNEYLAKVIIPALRGRYKPLYDEIIRGVNDLSLHRLKPWQVSMKSRAMKDKRFPDWHT